MDMLEPGRFGFAVDFKKRYGNYIGGEWVPPAKGQYFENVTPITGKPFCEIPRSTSSALERGTSQNGRPVIGVTFSKYRPLAGSTQRPPM